MTGEKVQTAKRDSSRAAAVVQCSLAIGAVNDPLEHEADAMADKVMRMQEVPPVSASYAGSIQRKCEDCEEEEKLQRKPLASFIQRKESSAGTIASDAVSEQINASRGNGSSMDNNTQTSMQSSFGVDFSDVKIHTGAESIQMNRELNAKAFTVGNDIYFNEGQYNPGSEEGKRLLAHELTHTVQQQGVKVTKNKNQEDFFQNTTNISKAPTMISKGEKWDAFWDVGPYDAYKAKKVADYALSAAKNTGLPGLRNGPGDAWRHCFWNCEMTKDIGIDQAKSIADNHEKHGSGPAIENLMDLRNNWEGRECGLKKGGCDTCCQDKLDHGTLDIIVGGKMVPSQKVVRSGSHQGASYYNK